MNHSKPASFFEDWRAKHHIHKEQYFSHKTSFIEGLLPEIALQFNVFETLELLHRKLGSTVLTSALNPNQQVPSPLTNHSTTDWMKKTKMVGVNVRTVGNFFNVIKYLLTVPNFHDSVHLLPIWEPGVVGSLYGKVSFNINPEFYSLELAAALPQLNTVEKQLKVVVNLIHAMGKSVGMDVIPHTDRFSEMVLAYPRYFEWVKRVGGRITSHSDNLYREVEEIIWLFLHRKGTANYTPLSYARSVFFSPDIPILNNEQRLEILFGYKNDRWGRLNRRVELMYELISQGYETLPMTMAPPYRGLHINPESFVLDENGNKWFDYEFDEPQGMSRVFGPLTRYKFYSADDENWQLNFNDPQLFAWEFIAEQYFEIQKSFNFDFMRGDMAHVQPRPDGVPTEDVQYYDPLLFIKKYIQKRGFPYFAFYAETFLAPPDVMGYGDELDHLEKIESEATLGDLQSSVMGSLEFMEKLTKYIELSETRKFKPSFTIITADKDDPRFDEFYRYGNVERYFIGLFLPIMPTYYSLGFEVRNQHLSRGKNEEYTKLYVFQIRDKNETDKCTAGSFEWGKNEQLFGEINRLRRIAEEILPELGNEIDWLFKPTMEVRYMIWTSKTNPSYVFVVNLDLDTPIDQAIIQKYIGTNAQVVYQHNETERAYMCGIYRNS